MDWQAIRELFPIVEHGLFFNHAGVAPISKRCADRLREWALDASGPGMTHYETWMEGLSRARSNVARLLNAEPEEIAFTKSTGHGVSLVAEGLSFAPGDNVVVPAMEYPANLYPWMHLERKGVEVRRLEDRGGVVDAEDFARAVDERTKVVAVSSVQYRNGYRTDLEAVSALCRERGIFCFADIIQSCGAFPLDMSRLPIDAAAADAHKWMLAPEGIAIFFARKSRVTEIEPVLTGWHTVKNAFEFHIIDFDMKETALRFEEGSHCVGMILALDAAVSLLLEIGVENIAERLLHLTGKFIEGIDARGWELHSVRDPRHRSGIVTFTIDGVNAEELVASLKREKVYLALRAGRLRVSPHIYNSDEEIEEFFAIADRLIDELR